MNADGSQPHLVVSGPSIGPEGCLITSPAWSPDGTKIVFHVFQRNSGINGLYTANPDGTGIALLFAGPVDTPDWQPLGHFIPPVTFTSTTTTSLPSASTTTTTLLSTTTTTLLSTTTTSTLPSVPTTISVQSVRCNQLRAALSSTNDPFARQVLQMMIATGCR